MPNVNGAIRNKRNRVNKSKFKRGRAMAMAKYKAAEYVPGKYMPKGDNRSFDDLTASERNQLWWLHESKVKDKPKALPKRSEKDGVPTAQREFLADGHFVVGDDRKGGRVYTFLDSSLSRIYSRLLKKAVHYRDIIDDLRVEYAALSWYQECWEQAGREVSYGAMDLNSVRASDPSRRTGMPMADRQIDAANKIREAQRILGHRPSIVVDNVVCSGHSLEIAGKALGWANKSQAISAAEEILRDAGYRLAKHRGIG